MNVGYGWGIDAVLFLLEASNITQDCLVVVDFLAKHECMIDFEGKSDR